MGPRCSWKVHHGDEPYIPGTVFIELYKMAYVQFKTERNIREPSLVRYIFDKNFSSIPQQKVLKLSLTIYPQLL
jgi:hypothetical protein